MKRYVLLTLLLIPTILCIQKLGELSAQKPPDVAVPAPTFRVGGKVDNLALRDLKGGDHNLFDLGKGSPVRVLLFIATQCPVSNAYNERMVELDRDYVPRNVKFIAINSNRQESVPEVESHAAKHGFTFTVYKDEGNVLADLFGASVTPEIYVFDKNWTMRYHGRIDDSQPVEKVTTRDLRTALDAVLAGGEPPVTETKAFGCTIKRVKKS